MKYLDDLVEQREELSVAQRGIIDQATEENRDLSDEESVSLDEMSERAEKLDSRIEQIRSVQLSELEAAKTKAEIAATTSDEVRTEAVGRVTITSQEKTYTERGENDFVEDLISYRMWNNPEAGQRLARHQAEMSDQLNIRAVGTAQFSALVVPDYAVNMAEAYARAGRPFLDFASTGRPLPSSGQTIEINRITTGSTNAIQASQNATVSSTDMASTTLSVPVVTVAGSQVVSRQAVDRGTGLTQAVTDDLVSAYHTMLDSQCLTGSGSSGQAKGIYTVLNGGGNEIAYTDASPTAAELFPKLANAINKCQTGSFKQPTTWVMHPRRIAWLISSVDSQNRPLMVPTGGGNASVNSYGSGEGAFSYGNTGYTLLGLPVVADSNVQTDSGSGSNEDVIYCVNRNESILWEQPGSPLMMNLEEPNATSLGWTFVVYGYSGYTAERNGAAGAHAMITGTGLVAPTF